MLLTRMYCQTSRVQLLLDSLKLIHTYSLVEALKLTCKWQTSLIKWVTWDTKTSGLILKLTHTMVVLGIATLLRKTAIIWKSSSALCKDKARKLLSILAFICGILSWEMLNLAKTLMHFHFGMLALIKMPHSLTFYHLAPGQSLIWSNIHLTL